MTYEKTLKRLDYFLKHVDDTIPADVVNMAVDCAVAIEYLIPKKPLRDNLDKAYLCPTCDSSFTFWRGYQTFEHKPNYCDACGQAIDWS